MRLKIRDSHLTCKVANKCLNVRERVEVLEWNKRCPPPFPCCSVNPQCLWKKTWLKKKYIYIYIYIYKGDIVDFDFCIPTASKYKNDYIQYIYNIFGLPIHYRNWMITLRSSSCIAVFYCLLSVGEQWDGIPNKPNR